MENKTLRLSKLLSERGICSRREADVWIQRGWIKVNGVVVTQLGTKVEPDVKIELAQEAKKDSQQKVTIILNKPVGYVSQNPEKGYVPAIRLIQQKNQWSPRHIDRTLKTSELDGLAVTGRLDIDSKGLLVFTQDGVLAKKIIGEDSDVEKEYLVWVDRNISPEHLNILRGPLELDDKKLKPMQIEQLAPQKLRMVLREGKKRQIRRVCEIAGLQVTSLQRVRVGRIRLGHLPEGKWRYLEEDEQF